MLTFACRRRAVPGRALAVQHRRPMQMKASIAAENHPGAVLIRAARPVAERARVGATGA